MKAIRNNSFEFFDNYILCTNGYFISLAHSSDATRYLTRKFKVYKISLLMGTKDEDQV